MKNEIKKADAVKRDNPLKKVSRSPFFGYIILILALAVLQLVYMHTDLITLTVSRALSQTIIYTMAAMGLSILVGMGGLISLGTAAFIGLGAYLAGNIMKALNMPYILVLLAVILVGLLIGIVVGFLSLRARGVHLLIITLALANVLVEVYARPNSFTGGPNGLSGVPFVKLFMTVELNRDTTFFLLLVVLFILIFITVNIINSPAGRALLAMNNSESLAQAMGISVLKYRIFAFAVATEYAILAGAMYIAYMRASNATTWMLTLGLNILSAVILGGGVKPAGAIMGSFILFGLDLAILKNIPFFQKNSSASLIFSGILIIIIVVKYPGGLTRMLTDIRAGAKRLWAKWRVYQYGEEK